MEIEKEQYILILRYSEKQREYINMLGDEIDGLISLASIHGWKSQNISCGKRLRHEMMEIDIQIKDRFNN